MSEPVTPRPSDRHVQSFARGLQVIRSFNASHPAQTLTEVAARTGLTRAGARRILLTLQGQGYVQAQGRHFSLTPRILELGFAYLSSQPLWHLAEPVMQGLAQTVQESCSMAVLDGAEIVYLLRVPARKIMSINRIGYEPAAVPHTAHPDRTGRGDDGHPTVARTRLVSGGR
jgi:IclR family pca regulon transcriptional regulator